MAIDSARLDPNRYIVLVSGPGLGAVIPPARSPGMVALEGHLLLPADVPRAHVTEETHCESSKTCSFIIQSYSRHGQVVDHNKARFKARLVGPAVTDATVTSVGGGTYNVSYIAHDVGQYKIEIVLLTVEGTGSAPDFIVQSPNTYMRSALLFRSKHMLHVIAARGQKNTWNNISNKCLTLTAKVS